MKAMIAGLALGMAVFGTAAHAEPIHVESAGVVLDNLPGFTEDRVSVLANTADVLQLSLTELLSRNSQGGTGWSAFDDQGNFQQTISDYAAGYQLRVKEGHSLSLVTLELRFGGQLQQAESPIDPPGQALNYTRNGMQVINAGSVVQSDVRHIDNLNGTQQVTFTFWDLAWAETVALELQSEVWMGAQGIPPNGLLPGLPSFASMNVTDAVLTIRTAVAPVPEPGTYAMLLAGLALVGTAARRRK
jgi:PEP-CTERM motif